MTQHQRILGISTFIVLIIGFFFFLGTTRYVYNPITRWIYRDYFLSEIQKSQKIDGEKFWEFRDFYTAGTSRFNPDQISKAQPFFTLTSPRMQSRDFLVPPGSPLIKPMLPPSGTISLIQSDRELVYRDGDSVIMRFVKSVPEMKTVNGFFGYFDADLKAYEGWLWYNESVISVL